MASDRDWIWDIIKCPECGNSFARIEDSQAVFCSNSACEYSFKPSGRVFNLLPLKLDSFQKAENEFRESRQESFIRSFPEIDEEHRLALLLLNSLTSYEFTSGYKFFRDFFSKKYTIRGRGLELGGATGHASGFLKLLYPDIDIVTSDIAPTNVTFAEKIAELVGFDTDYFVMADAERLPFAPDSFDFVFSSGMLHHLGDLRTALQKTHSVLKPEGLWFIINELSIGSIPRLYWNSRLGAKGKHSRKAGIHEKSYTFQEWKTLFESGGFSILETYFHRNPDHKLMSWSRSFYYAIVSKLPERLIRLGVPCEVCFVLERT